MTFQEAFKLITDICTAYKGTLKDHQLIQEALQTIRKKDDVNEDKTEVKD